MLELYSCRHRSRSFGIMGGHDLFFGRWTHGYWTMLGKKVEKQKIEIYKMVERTKGLTKQIDFIRFFIKISQLLFMKHFYFFKTFQKTNNIFIQQCLEK
jgi:hypothetical protein